MGRYYGIVVDDINVRYIILVYICNIYIHTYLYTLVEYATKTRGASDVVARKVLQMRHRSTQHFAGAANCKCSAKDDHDEYAKT